MITLASRRVVVGVALAALTVAGCASQPQVVVRKEEAECKVPNVVTDPVAGPAQLVPGATNGDMKVRMDQLDAALEKANGRLGDVQKTLSASQTTKAAPATLRDRLRALLGQ